MDITKSIYDELVRITKKEKPYEACAYLFKDNTIVVKGEPSIQSSGYFEVTNPERIGKLMDDYGIPSALFHSHPCAAIPSSTDKMYMVATTLIYHCPWLIMSDTFRLRAWKLTKKTRIGIEEIEVNIING